MSFILSDTIHIMIQMKKYSICINNIFCLVLDKIIDIFTNFTGIWYFNEQNILNLSKNVSFEVSCN